jgi:hypothetical protein
MPASEPWRWRGNVVEQVLCASCKARSLKLKNETSHQRWGSSPVFSIISTRRSSLGTQGRRPFVSNGPCQAGEISKAGGDPIDRNCNSSPLSTGRPSARGMTEPNCPIVRILRPSPLARHSLMAGDDVPSGIQAGQPIATPCFKVFDRGAWKSGETSGVQT